MGFYFSIHFSFGFFFNAFCDQLKKLDLMTYNKIVFTFFFGSFLGGWFYVLAGKYSRKLSWQKTVYLSLQLIFLKNNIKFHMYLMSWIEPFPHGIILEAPWLLTGSSKLYEKCIHTCLSCFLMKIKLSF